MGGEAALNYADSLPELLGQEGLQLGSLYAGIKDTIDGVDGTFTALHGTNSPFPPSMGSTDWPKIMTLFNIDASYGQALVQPILMTNYGLDHN